MTGQNPQPSPTDLDLFRRLATEPAGTFKLFRARGVGTEENIGRHLGNLDELRLRLERALRADCLIEVISLRLQIIDFWLRIYFVNKAPASETRDRKFGRLIDQCKRLALNPSLVARLKNFNHHRIDAIHGYVIGTTTYQNLRPVVTESEALLKDVVVFVVSNAGEVVSGLDEHGEYPPGSMILHVAGFLQEVRSGARY